MNDYHVRNDNRRATLVTLHAVCGPRDELEPGVNRCQIVLISAGVALLRRC
jgi:hypothetical protein